MIRYVLFIISFILFLNGDDILNVQKQNTLYVQNLIEKEEQIAKAFEKYILTEFKIPTLKDLKTDYYLGADFSFENKMGDTIAFLDTKNLKIKYALSKEEYRKSRADEDIKNYLVLLYNRDLYRDYTSAYDNSTVNNASFDSAQSFVSIILKSEEAKTFFEILNESDAVIEKECNATLVNKYCNNNAKTFRWYNASSHWIEYNKINRYNSNVTVSSPSLLSDTKLNDLAVGTHIFVENSTKYVKLVNDSSGNLQILKVD